MRRAEKAQEQAVLDWLAERAERAERSRAAREAIEAARAEAEALADMLLMVDPEGLRSWDDIEALIPA